MQKSESSEGQKAKVFLRQTVMRADGRDCRDDSDKEREGARGIEMAKRK